MSVLSFVSIWFFFRTRRYTFQAEKQHNSYTAECFAATLNFLHLVVDVADSWSLNSLRSPTVRPILSPSYSLRNVVFIYFQTLHALVVVVVVYVDDIFVEIPMRTRTNLKRAGHNNTKIRNER